MRRWLIVIVVIAAAAAGGFFWLRPFQATAAAARTTTATRGTLVVGVDLTGTISSAAVTELSFGAGGTVKSVSVNVGDTVTRGQVLATIDTSLLDAQLASAKASLASAQAHYLIDKEGPNAIAIAAARDAVTSAQLALSSASQSQHDATPLNAASIASAQNALKSAQDKLTADQAPPDPNTVAAAQDAVNQAQLALNNAMQSQADTQSQNDQAIKQAQTQLTFAQMQLTNDTAERKAQNVIDADNQAVVAAQQNLDSANLKAQQAEHQAANSVANAQSALDAAQHNFTLKVAPTAANVIQADQLAVHDAQIALQRAQDQSAQAVHQAQNQVASAEQQLASAQDQYQQKVEPATPDTIAADQQGIANAQASVVSAQQAVQSGTITATAGGTITAVNIIVGQRVSAGAGAANGASASSSSSSSSSSSGSATGQIEVTDLTALRIVGQASETDITKITMGQAATITADALGSQTLTGKVCAIADVGVQVQGVTSYAVTVCPDGSATGLKVGMSATASVIVSRVDDAVLVPSLAITTQNGQRVVEVVKADGSVVPTAVEVGLTNGSQTQITSGLSEGQTIQLSVQSTTGGQNRGGGFGGGILRGLGG